MLGRNDCDNSRNRRRRAIVHKQSLIPERRMPRLNLLASLALLAALALPVAPAVAGPAESALLAKYAGDWKGTGKVTGPDPGTVVCRMSLKPSASGKLTYSGRCTYSGQGTASFRGTIQYNDASNRYEAASSGQGVSANT